MKLAVFGGSSLIIRDGKYYGEDTFPLFLKSLAEFCDGIEYCAPVFTSSRDGDFGKSLSPMGFDHDGINLIAAYPTRTLIGFYKRLPWIFCHDIRKYWKAVRHCDVVFLRLPSPAALFGFFISLMQGKKYVTYYASDIKNVVFYGHKYRGVLRCCAVAAAYLHYHFFKLMASRSAVSLFLSRELMNRHRCKHSYFCFASIVGENAVVMRRACELRGKDSVSLLYVGRITHEKGLHDLIMASKLLIDEGRSIKVSICGEGPERVHLEKLCNELDINRYVQFMGYVPQGRRLESIFRDNDIFVLPSISEGTPKVLLEAMAKGIPIVATRVGGVPDIVDDRVNGILVSPGSPESIAGAVREYINDCEMMNSIIGNAYDFVKKHTAQRQAENIAGYVYKHVCFGEQEGECCRKN